MGFLIITVFKKLLFSTTIKDLAAHLETIKFPCC